LEKLGSKIVLESGRIRANGSVVLPDHGDVCGCGPPDLVQARFVVAAGLTQRRRRSGFSGPTVGARSNALSMTPRRALRTGHTGLQDQIAQHAGKRTAVTEEPGLPMFGPCLRPAARSRPPSGRYVWIRALPGVARGAGRLNTDGRVLIGRAFFPESTRTATLLAVVSGPRQLSKSLESPGGM
jgi:hypothetical protein